MLEELQRVADIEFIRVEDAPASHTEAHYSFISNEVYVRFRSEQVDAPGRLLGVLPVRRRLVRPVMTLDELERQLTGMGHAELAANALTISAMTGMLDQLLPVEYRKALNELGAVEYHLPSDPA